MKLPVTLWMLLILSGTWVALAQAPTSALGAVTKIDAAAKALTLKTDSGAEIAITLLPNASVRRVAPGETNLNNAANITMSEISVGDRVLARGQNGNATLLVVISQSDIAKKQAAERADWDHRGVLGTVTAAGADSITISSRTLAGTTQITILPGENALVRRYAPDSVKFSDAKPAKLTDIKVGDQVRARGSKAADGMKLTAEEIVAGAFKTIAAVVISIDAQAGEMRVTNLESQKPLAVKVDKDCNMRKLLPQVAQNIAIRVHPELAAAAKSGPNGAPPDFQQILERSPSVTLADLKAGDAIVVSSTVGASADRVTAITLLTGVEPILTKPGTRQMSLGAWNLDMVGGRGQ